MSDLLPQLVVLAVGGSIAPPLLLLTTLFLGSRKPLPNATALGLGFQPLGWEVALYGLLSLTLIHVLPVAASLVGTGLGGASVALMGWVGPRGPNLSPTVVFSSFISTLIPLVVEVVDPACYASIPS